MRIRVGDLDRQRDTGKTFRWRSRLGRRQSIRPDDIVHHTGHTYLLSGREHRGFEFSDDFVVEVEDP